MRISWPTIGVSLLLASNAFAQDAPAREVRPVGQYEGVTPGVNQTPAHIRPRPGTRPVTVTWPGFQPRTDGASRFFVQTTASVEYAIQVEGNRVVVLLRNARVADRQSRRPLVTRFFNTPVTRAYIERRRRDLALVLEMRADVQPSVTVEAGEGGYSFLYVSFAPGNYATAEAAPTAGAPSPTAPAPATPP